MPLVGPPLLFHDLPIVVIFDPGLPLPKARRVHAAIHGLVVRLAETDQDADTLPETITNLVAEYGCRARLSARTRRSMEFFVTGGLDEEDPHPLTRVADRDPGGRSPASVALQPRLVLLCGLPASDKTTLARKLAIAYRAVRLNPDEWKVALDVDPFDDAFRSKLEAQFWELTERLLGLGVSVVLEWGLGARSERDEKREAARSIGAAVELRFLDVPHEDLVRRVGARHAAGGLAITDAHLERYRDIVEPPTDDELALYDPPVDLTG